jgi:DNA-binding NarL/FixJ family response regulator
MSENQPISVGAEYEIPVEHGILTSRQIEILTLVASGDSSSEIGGKLFITEQTVKNHRIEIYDRLNVNTSPAALKVAAEQGIIHPPSLVPADFDWEKLRLLSSTERRVLAEFANAGSANEAIAEKMDLSMHTIKWHFRNIYRKTGLINRDQAMIILLTAQYKAEERMGPHGGKLLFEFWKRGAPSPERVRTITP